jgi:uncharacterized protein (TIGR02217 family)
MAFIEERLLDCVSYGTQGGPAWNTRRVPLRSGVERRNAQSARPRYRFIILYQNLSVEHHVGVIDAFNACRAGLHAFRLKDWSDFTADDELVTIGTGSPQTVQLTKLYEFGNQNVSRTIRKPVTGTVVLTADNLPQAGSIDYTTGMATFTAPIGDIVRWSGEFDVPVTFDQDELMFSANSRNASGLVLTSDITLSEDLSA